LRHEASKMEPTVHGSWPKEFLFYKPHTQTRSNVHRLNPCLKKRSNVPRTNPVKTSGTPGSVELSPYWRDGEDGELDERREEHGGPIIRRTSRWGGPGRRGRTGRAKTGLELGQELKGAVKTTIISLAQKNDFHDDRHLP
jgi:hypothetical protein